MIKWLWGGSMYCIVSKLIICIGNDETKSIGLELLKSLVEFCIYLSRFVIIFMHSLESFFVPVFCNQPYLTLLVGIFFWIEPWFHYDGPLFHMTEELTQWLVYLCCCVFVVCSNNISIDDQLVTRVSERRVQYNCLVLFVDTSLGWLS